MKVKIDVDVLRSKGILVFGDPDFRGDCPKEEGACQTIVNQTKKRYPNLVFMHIKNEGARRSDQIKREKAMGFITGASDYLFVGYPMMALEVKRSNPKLSTIDTQQIEFLEKVISLGGIAVVALGGVAGVEAVEYFISKQKIATCLK